MSSGDARRPSAIILREDTGEQGDTSALVKQANRHQTDTGKRYGSQKITHRKHAANQNRTISGIKTEKKVFRTRKRERGRVNTSRKTAPRRQTANTNGRSTRHTANNITPNPNPSRQQNAHQRTFRSTRRTRSAPTPSPRRSRRAATVGHTTRAARGQAATA